MNRIRARVLKVFEKPSRTKQSYRDECDINLIMKRFKTSDGKYFLDRYCGHADGRHFDDFSVVSDYRSAIESVRLADEAFASLPSKVREHFSNDAGAFVDFCANPDNLTQLREWGLAKKEEPGT